MMNCSLTCLPAHQMKLLGSLKALELTRFVFKFSPFAFHLYDFERVTLPL